MSYFFQTYRRKFLSFLKFSLSKTKKRILEKRKIPIAFFTATVTATLAVTATLYKRNCTKGSDPFCAFFQSSRAVSLVRLAEFAVFIRFNFLDAAVILHLVDKDSWCCCKASSLYCIVELLACELIANKIERAVYAHFADYGFIAESFARLLIEEVHLYPHAVVETPEEKVLELLFPFAAIGKVENHYLLHEKCHTCVLYDLLTFQTCY